MIKSIEIKEKKYYSDMLMENCKEIFDDWKDADDDLRRCRRVARKMRHEYLTRGI